MWVQAHCKLIGAPCSALNQTPESVTPHTRQTHLVGSRSSVPPPTHGHIATLFGVCLQSFFTRWWREQSNATQALVKQLVADGQLDFVNGGYVQHDEAAAHYVSMVDQTTRGHRLAVVLTTCWHLCMQVVIGRKSSAESDWLCTACWPHTAEGTCCP